MKNKSKIIWLALLISCFSLLAGCGGKKAQVYSMPGSWAEIVGPTGSQPAPLTVDVASRTLQQPRQVALLLPLSGRLAKSGQAVRNGFLAAYYYSKDQEAFAPDIKVYDSAEVDSGDLYSQAINDGADFVVGPLTKQQVMNLSVASHSSQVPVLALNTLDNYQSSPINDFYQFGLASQDEVIQLAAKVYHDGGVNTLLIAPKSSWGENVSNIFSANFTARGGQVIDSLYYSSDSNLAAEVSRLLTTDQSRQRALQLKRVIRARKFKYTLRRRQDFNAVVLLANPQQARQIKPLLDFYYAGTVPVYATSLVYSGRPNFRANQDLNGVMFCDIPWIIGGESGLPDYLNAIRKQVMQLWPRKHAQYNRLYALGIDAYNLMPFLRAGTTAFPQEGINAASGVLHLDQYNHIYRQLKWAKFSKGQI